jgi:hypothetical protein
MYCHLAMSEIDLGFLMGRCWVQAGAILHGFLKHLSTDWVWYAFYF